MTLAPKRVLQLAVLLLAVVVVASALLFASGSSGLLPWTAAAAKAQTNAITVAAAKCSVKYGALDSTQTKANPDKVSPEDLGPRVNAKTVAEAEAALKERRTCGTDGEFDTELLATQYADWSAEGLTSQSVPFSQVDAFRHQLNADKNLYGKTLAEIESLEGHSVASIGSVPKGVWSVYALPTGNGDLTTHVGHTGSVGTALVFAYKGKTIKYRLECGFQIVREVQPAGIPACAYANCGPKPVAPKPTPPPATHVKTCQELGNCVTTPTPTCVSAHGAGWTGNYPVCKGPATEDPYVQGHAPIGGGHNATNGPGTYESPAKAATQQPGTAPRVNPPAPTTGSTGSSGAKAPVVKPSGPASPAPPTDTSGQTNNGSVSGSGSGATCNPVVMSC